MKTISAVLLSLFAISAFATDLASKVREIESEKNAKCTEVKTSYKFCLGGVPNEYNREPERLNSFLNTCRYSVTFDCVSNTGDFTVKMKVKEKYSSRAGGRTAQVTKVIFR